MKTSIHILLALIFLPQFGFSQNYENRFHRIERQLVDLQNRVLNLEEGLGSNYWTCKITTHNFGRIHYGETMLSRGAAERSAYMICVDRESVTRNCSPDRSDMDCVN